MIRRDFLFEARIANVLGEESPSPEAEHKSQTRYKEMYISSIF
jgi:hypothetical protein